jgi:hypothetical protein
MTPLPGTELQAERKSEILSHKPELYDMLHILLPTKLPMAEFYRELAELYTKAVPLHRSLPSLLKFGRHGMLLRIKVFSRLLEKFNRMHLDY